MFGMRIQTFMYGTPTGMYTMDVHENCDCDDRSYHISAMMSAGPIIQDGSAIEVRIRRLEGVVDMKKVADRHFVVEMRMPWDSIESDVLNILNSGPKNKQYNDHFSTVERSLENRMDPNKKGYASMVKPWFQQPDVSTSRSASDVVISAGSQYGSFAGMITSMGGIADETSRDKYRDRLKDMLSIEKDGPGSPPTTWDYDGNGKYPRPR